MLLCSLIAHSSGAGIAARMRRRSQYYHAQHDHTIGLPASGMFTYGKTEQTANGTKVPVSGCRACGTDFGAGRDGVALEENHATEQSEGYDADAGDAASS